MKIDKEKSITYSKYWSHSNPNQDRNRINLYSVLKKIQNFLNRYILNKLGLEVRKKQSSMRKEQISYINNTEILSLRNEQIANFLVEFGVINNIPFDKGKILKNIELFDEIFKKNKITDLNGGLGYNNGLFLFLTFSHFQPQLIIESGIWRGFTTYLIDKATSENSKIYCFDINLDRVEFKSKKASYYENDLTLIDDVGFSDVDFAFFDDHVSIYDRLLLCLQNNIEVVIVDDDVSLSQVHSDGWPPIPTASMIYDYNNIPKKFDWITNSVYRTADISDLDVKGICDFYRYIPFPKLGDFTGYMDTSFTSLLLKNQNN